MAKTIYSVSLSLEVSEKFNKELKKSALVEKLLAQHYQINPTQRLKEITEDLDKLNIEKDFLEAEANREKVVQEAADEEGKRLFELNAKERWQKFFKQDLGRELTEEEYAKWREFHHDQGVGYKDFIERLKNGL